MLSLLLQEFPNRSSYLNNKHSAERARCILCLKIPVSFNKLHARRHLQLRPPLRQVLDCVFLSPIQKSVKVPTLLDNIEVRKRLRIRPVWLVRQIIVHPVVRDDADVGVAHEILQQHVDAVLLVLDMVGRQLGGVQAAVVTIVVAKVNLFSQFVETVDLMHDIDLCDVRLWSSAPALGRLNAQARGLAREDDIVLTDSYNLEAFSREAIPGCVDLRRWILAVNGSVIMNAPVKALEVWLEIDLVEEWCFRPSVSTRRVYRFIGYLQ